MYYYFCLIYKDMEERGVQYHLSRHHTSHNYICVDLNLNKQFFSPCIFNISILYYIYITGALEAVVNL